LVIIIKKANLRLSVISTSSPSFQQRAKSFSRKRYLRGKRESKEKRHELKSIVSSKKANDKDI
jgi:hypothetical protein